MRLDEAKRAGRRARARADRLRRGRPARAHRPAIRAGARRRRSRSDGLPAARRACPSCATAIAGWCRAALRRRARPGHARSIPTLRQQGGDLQLRPGARRPRRRPRHGASCTEPGYPVPERGAAFAGARGRSRCRCSRRTASCPTSTRVDDETWERTAILWVNYPNNPTGAVAPLALLRARSRRSPPSTTSCSPPTRPTASSGSTSRPARRSRSRTGANVAVFNTLSQALVDDRATAPASSPATPSSSPRCAPFRPDRRDGAAGVRPARLDRRLGRRGARRAARARATARKRDAAARRARAARACAWPASEATMYLWVEVPAGETSEEFAERLLEHGIVVTPGSYLGPSGEGYVRFALVPTEEDCRAPRASSRRAVSIERRRDRPPVGGRRRAATGAAAIEEAIGCSTAGELRVAEPRDGEWVVNEWTKQAILALLPAARDGADRGRPVRVPRQDPAQARLRGARRARRAARRSRATARSSRRASS